MKLQTFHILYFKYENRKKMEKVFDGIKVKMNERKKKVQLHHTPQPASLYNV